MMLDNALDEYFCVSLAKQREYILNKFSGESIVLNFSLVCPAVGSIWIQK